MTLVEKLKQMSATELEAYANENNIDLYGTTTIAEMLETVLNFVPIEEFPVIEEKAPENVIKVEYKEKQVQEPKPKKEKKSKDVALYAIRNLYWNGVGELTAGYNIVSKEDSEKWLTLKSVRVASAEEVATYYGK